MHHKFAFGPIWQEDYLNCGSFSQIDPSFCQADKKVASTIDFCQLDKERHYY